MELVIDMPIVSQDVSSQNDFDFTKTHQRFNVTLKTKVELKRQRHLYLKEKQEKLSMSLASMDIFRKIGKTMRWDDILLTLSI